MYGGWKGSVRAMVTPLRGSYDEKGEEKKEKKKTLCTVKQESKTRRDTIREQVRFSGRSFTGERTPALAAYQPAGISSYSDIIPNDGALKGCHLYFQSEKT